jgi:hypothetical protein
LPKADPFDQLNMLLDSRIGLAGESGSDDFFNASFSRCVREQPRVNAVASNNCQSV